MTEELLKKMNVLSDEIGELKKSLRRIEEVEKEGKSIRSVESSNGVVVRLPKEITEELVFLIEIKLRLMLKKKTAEFESGGLGIPSVCKKQIPCVPKAIDEFDDDDEW